MALVVDTSVIVRALSAESGREAALALITGTEILLIAPLTRHEFLSAINRKRRGRRMTAMQYRDTRAMFDRFLKEALLSIPLTEKILHRAHDLLDRFQGANLRTLDAVQLAGALEVPHAEFVTADRRLAPIARRAEIRTRLLSA